MNPTDTTPEPISPFPVPPSTPVAPVVMEEVIDDSVVTPAVEQAVVNTAQSTDTAEAAVVEESVDEKDLLIKPQNVELQFPVFIKLDKFNPEETTLPLPSGFPSYVAAQIQNAPNTRLDDTKKTGTWSATMMDGMQLVPKEDAYRSTLENENAHFVQAVQSDSGLLHATAPSFKSKGGETLDGERGVLRFMRFAGLGSIFMIPLWHTGIWITLKSPSEAKLLELQREIISEKIQLGRTSYGLALSSIVSCYSEKILKLAMEQLYQSNLKTDKNLFEIISSHDIPTIIWGMACAIWNNGFQYERSCTHDPSKCNHVVQEKLDITKLLWVNKSALSAWQVSHMTRKKLGDITLEDVERYKKETLQMQDRRCEMKMENGNVYSFDLKVPTIKEYIEYSNDWINSMAEMVEMAVGSDNDENKRNAFIVSHAQSSLMRQYTHWVKGINFEDNVIEDKSTIESILDRLSGEDEVRTKFLEEVKKYINDSAISVVGSPSYECPSCHKEQKYTAKNDSLTSIIPMDILQTFFSLHVQKISSIDRRG